MTTSNSFGSTFAVFPNTQSQAKNYKRATKPTHLNRNEMTTKQPTEKEGRRHNRRLAQWRVTWLIEHSTSHQLLWCIDSFVLRNPPLRQAPKRCRQATIAYMKLSKID
ncbi:MAG: hypothetical protein R2831_12490 [Chitinophagaceae bacterium]